jgi:hypothetical protein
MESIISNRRANIGTPSTRARHPQVTPSPAQARAMRDFRRGPNQYRKSGRRREDVVRTRRRSLPHLQAMTQIELAPARLNRREEHDGWRSPAKPRIHDARSEAPRRPHHPQRVSTCTNTPKLDGGKKIPQPPEKLQYRAGPGTASQIAGEDIAPTIPKRCPQRRRTARVCGRNRTPTTSKTAKERSRPAWPRANPNATGGQRRRWRVGHAAAHPRPPSDPEDPARPCRAQI